MARLATLDETLTTVGDYIESHGYAPTVRDVMRGIGLASTNTAALRVQGLIDAGFVTHTPGLSRTLLLTDAGAARYEQLLTEAVSA